MGETMRAVIATGADGPLRVARVPRPVAGTGEVLVRVVASGTNPLDAKIRTGSAPHARQPLPATLGLDMAGVVEAVGTGVDRLAPGDAVYGMVGGVGGLPGTLAEYVVADADLLAPKPVSLGMREAAALPLVAITAWEGLVERLDVGPGDRVLVQGGAGGVGHVAVQVARALGARVAATGSARGRATIERLGATFVDRDEPVADFVGRLTDGRGFDKVYDTAGGPALDAAFAAVRRLGRVTSCLGWGTHALAPLSFKGAAYAGVFTLPPLIEGGDRARLGAILSRIADFVERGALVPILDGRRFTLDAVDEAYRLMREGGARGKLVIDVAPQTA